MTFDDALSLTPATAPNASTTAKKKFVIDFEEFFLPKIFLGTG